MWSALSSRADDDGDDVPLVAAAARHGTSPERAGSLEGSEDSVGPNDGQKLSLEKEESIRNAQTAETEGTRNSRPAKRKALLRIDTGTKQTVFRAPENFGNVPLRPLNSNEVPGTGDGIENGKDTDNSDSDDEFMPRPEAHDLADEQILSAVLPQEDDPSLPTLTFRFWVLSTFLTTLAAAVGQFYYFRSTSLTLSLFFVQLLSYLLGNGMAKWLPDRRFRIFGFEFNLNDGPFNVKEHALIVVSASTSLGVAYAIDILAVQRLFYKTDIGPVGSILLLVTTQSLGYGMAGMLRKFLVEKKEMIWPGTLPIVALFQTLHGKDETGPSHAKNAMVAERRMNFFTTVFFAALLYGFLPSYIAPTLTSIAFLCLLGGGPQGTISRTVAQLGSGYQGAGLGTVTLDWNYIGSAGPLYTPLWANVNYIGSAIFFAWVVTPILYHLNLWDAQNFPIFGTSSYSRNGTKWNATEVMNANLTLNEVAYEENPIRLSTFWAVMYGLSFLNLSAVLVHVYLYHGHEVWERFRTARDSLAPDVHTVMMRAYKDVPDALYLGIFGVMLVVSMISVEVFGLQLPWWGVILAVLVAGVFVLPVGILQAVSNQQVGLNVLTEFIAGMILPGEPIANIVFKTYGYMSMSQALSLVSDLKLGHYLKVPPRSMIVAQLWGTIVGSLVNYAVMDWIVRNVDLLNNPDPQWNPRASHIFYTASLIWGAVGPARLFGANSPYRPLLWFFLAGVILPIPFYYLHKKYPNRGWDLVCIPIIALGAGANGGAGANWLITSLCVAWFFMGHVRHRYPTWFANYNFTLSAALDSGSMFAAIIVFLLFTLPGVPYAHWALNPKGDIEYCATGNFTI